MVNTTLIVFMIVTIVLLFTAMILSAMASSDAQKGGTTCKEGCHKYSMWSALVTGIAVAVIVIILIIYIYTSRKHIAAAALQHVAALHGTLGGIAGIPRVALGTNSGMTAPSASQVMASLG